MSKTTYLDGVVIRDIGILRQAVEELRGLGLKVRLEENVKPRAYFEQQADMGVAPYTLVLEDSPYDVGFYHNEKMPGTYTARADLHAGHIGNVLGTRQVAKGESRDQADLGKLYQMYGVCAAEMEAFRQGYSTSRSVTENGTINVVMTVAA